MVCCGNCVNTVKSAQEPQENANHSSKAFRQELKKKGNIKIHYGEDVVELCEKKRTKYPKHTKCLYNIIKAHFRNCCHRQHVLSHTVHVSVGKVCAVIPKFNVFGHSDFNIKVIEDSSSVRIINQCCSSPVIYMQPHGSKFFKSHPATIYLPVCSKPGEDIICLCSDTAIGEKAAWKSMNRKDYQLYDGYVKITTTHFSFYTTIINRGYPEVSQMICAGEGGVLEIPHIPGLQVLFPGSAVHYDIEATMKVMFADEPYDVDHDDPASFALAAPVVKLGPTGHHFNPDSKEKVQVRLPLPNARGILENCGRPYLTFWESTTAEGQPLEWKLFKCKYAIDVDDDGTYSVYFPVCHFTFFKVLWSVFDSALYEAKIGASFFYPHFEFCVILQAFISLNEDKKTFGLCLLCYRVGNPLDNVGNFPIFVGSSGPRMVTSGLLRIRIASKIFEANADFGEEVLQQQEFFTGRPFDKQFACKYVTPNAPVFGTIGKVYIEKIKNDGNAQPLFDFLLNKPRPGQEMPQAQSNNNVGQRSEMEEEKTWEMELSRELATLLNIKTDCNLEDGVWEEIAHNLGYTQLEIDMKFKGEDDPLMKLLEDYKKRGGSPNEFISTMYKIGRKENVNAFEQRIRQALPEPDSDLKDNMAGKNGSLSPSRSSSTSGIVLPSMPTNSRKRRHSIENKGPVPSGKLIEIAKEKTVQEKWKNLGRALGVDDNQLLEIERDYENDGIQEKAYQMLLAWKERYPDDGYNELIKALGKWHLNGVARLLYC